MYFFVILPSPREVPWSDFKNWALESETTLDPIRSSASHCVSLGKFLNLSELVFSMVKCKCLPIRGLLREYWKSQFHQGFELLAIQVWNS